MPSAMSRLANFSWLSARPFVIIEMQRAPASLAIFTQWCSRGLVVGSPEVKQTSSKRSC